MSTKPRYRLEQFRSGWEVHTEYRQSLKGILQLAIRRLQEDKSSRPACIVITSTTVPKAARAPVWEFVQLMVDPELKDKIPRRQLWRYKDHIPELFD